MTIALSWEKKAARAETVRTAKAARAARAEARAARAKAARTSKYLDPDHIDTMVGDKLCTIHRSWRDTTYAELLEIYQAQGLEGDALHRAVLKDLPERLAELLPEAMPVEDPGRRTGRRHMHTANEA
jgi:hypothetical protein